eukprot:11789724-Heterocapsa_arctica.AAC.1
MAKAVRRRPPTAVLRASSRMSDCCLPLSGCSKRTRVCGCLEGLTLPLELRSDTSGLPDGPARDITPPGTMTVGATSVAR